MRLPGFRRHPVSDEAISAYIDRRLPPRESERIEGHLHACADCRRKLAEMKALVSELRRLPQVTAPRSFALSAEQVTATRRPAAEKERMVARRLYLGLSRATVAAALLLCALVGANVLGGVGNGSGGVQQGSTLSSQKTAASRMEADTPANVPGAGAMDSGAKQIAPSTAPLPGTAGPTNGYSADAPLPAATALDEEAQPLPQAQPVAKGSHPVWLWVLEGTMGGLVVGFGVSAFWMRWRSKR